MNHRRNFDRAKQTGTFYDAARYWLHVARELEGTEREDALERARNMRRHARRLRGRGKP